MNRGPLIIGHRGASAHAPENTIAAFRAAIESGADGVEFDVQLARDGVPVVIHDPTLDRTGRQKGLVAELTSKQLGTVDVGSWFNARYPARAQAAFDHETVPALTQVLELLAHHGGLIYIELKATDDTFRPLTEAIANVIRDSPLLRRIIVKSFHLAVIAEIRARVPGVATAALFSPAIRHLMRRRKNIIDIARDAGADQLSLHHSLASRRLVSLAAEINMPVTIWTADNSAWIERCRTRDIGALITNDPERLVVARDAILASNSLCE